MNITYKLLMFCIMYIAQIQSFQDQTALFLHGQELFAQENYAEALQVYEKIEHKNFMIWYNMAICSVHLHQKAQATLFLKRAERQAHTYAELTQVDQLFSLYYDTYQHIDSWYDQVVLYGKRCILSIPLLLLQLLILCGLLYIMAYWYAEKNKIYTKKSIIIIFLWLLLYSIWLYRLYNIEKVYVVVMKSDTPVYSGPDDSFNKKINAQDADIAQVVDRHNNYLKIKLHQTVGWVHSDDVQRV